MRGGIYGDHPARPVRSGPYGCTGQQPNSDLCAPLRRLAWLIRAKLWPEWYPNSRDVEIDGGASDLSLGASFRWRTFGAPVSLGCIRLNKFQSKLARWWTPSQAKFFVYFEPNRYRVSGDAATGRAKGFRSPQDPETEIAAAAPRPASRTVSSRAYAYSPFGFYYLATAPVR